MLGLTVLAVTGYLFLHGLYRNGLFIFVASVGGWVLNWVLKAAFARARPDIVPHLREVVSSSFPSGHALTSAAVYLTLGALLMRIAEGRLAKYYCIAIAMFVTFLVGVQPGLPGRPLSDDVVAGWLIGMTWALLCWVVERMLERRAGLKREKRSSSRPADGRSQSCTADCAFGHFVCEVICSAIPSASRPAPPESDGPAGNHPARGR